MSIMVWMEIRIAGGEGGGMLYTLLQREVTNQVQCATMLSTSSFLLTIVPVQSEWCVEDG